MRKLLCTFLMALLTLTVFAQDDNIRRPHRRPVKQQQQVTSGSGQPSKPSKPTMPTKPVVPTTPSKPSAQPTEPTTPSKITTQPSELSVPSNPTTDPSKPTIPSMPTVLKPTTGSKNGYEWVDLGLSVKWATNNVGASLPDDYGGYYAWGETSTKWSYDWDTCFDCIDINNWNQDSGWGIYKKGGQTKILPSSGHDTARANWGSTWRMPTDAEFEELCKKCKWTWTVQNGNHGYTVTGPNGNNIFLPAAGCRYGNSAKNLGGQGYYWSSTLSSSHSGGARLLFFDDSSHGANSIGGRNYGHSIRPVTN